MSARCGALLACAAAAAALAAALALAPPPRCGSPAEGFDAGGLPYGVFQLPDALTAAECKTLVDVSAPLLKRSMVVNPAPAGDGDKEKLDAARTSFQTWIPESHERAGPVVRKLMAAAAALTGVRRSDLMEAVMVARYEPGQKYDAHHDSCTHGCTAPVYRLATLLVYLNDDFEGGTTTFPKIPLEVRPQRGKGVLFYNTYPDTGAVIPESLHSGDPVVSGQKFIATVWIKFPPGLHGFGGANPKK